MEGRGDTADDHEVSARVVEPVQDAEKVARHGRVVQRRLVAAGSSCGPGPKAARSGQ
jgi:hypothetical protein